MRVQGLMVNRLIISRRHMLIQLQSSHNSTNNDNDKRIFKIVLITLRQYHRIEL